nr:putative reverse transcriptase domain-containing protein [Tanacetum cinerariifolium]
MKRTTYRRRIPAVTSLVQVKEKSPARVPDVESEEDPEEDPHKDSEKEGEPKKKRLKEASESDSNTLPLDNTSSNEETEPDLDSTARGLVGCKKTLIARLSCINPIPFIVMAPTRRSGASGDDANPNIVAIIAQQLQNIIPQITTDVHTRSSWLVSQETLMEKEARGHEAALGMTWEEFKALLVEEFYPNNEMEKLETEFYHHVMVGVNHAASTNRFHELAKLVQHLVTPESKHIERYIYGLALQIRRMIRATQPAIIYSAILKDEALTEEVVRYGTLSKSSEKMKEVVESRKQGGSWFDNKRVKLEKGFVVGVPTRNEYAGAYPRMGNNQRVCYECGSPDHFRNTCPKLNQAPSQVGNCLTIVGADFSFISTNFVPLLNMKPIILGSSYVIEIANGRKVESNKIIRGCKLELGYSLFNIDLIPFGHESFDVIVGLDWLSRHKAMIVFHEKVVRIPLENGKVLVVHKERTEERLKSMKGTRLDESKLTDILIVRDFLEYLDKFVLVFINDILIYSKSKEDHKVHLKLVMELLKKEKLLAKFSKCEFWLQEVRFLGHVVNKNGYYWRFIANFAKIAKPIISMTWKNHKYEWGMEKEEAFQTLKDNLCNAPILSLLDGPNDFLVYYAASNQGFRCVLMQRGKVIAYALRQLKIHERNYTTHDLELGAMVFALKTWRHYLYGTKSVIYTNHKCLQHIFKQKELNMHQRKWIELFSDYDYEIRYHPGKANVVVDALSRKERVKPRRVRAMSMTIQSSVKDMILAAQGEASKVENAPTKMLCGMDQQMEKRKMEVYNLWTEYGFHALHSKWRANVTPIEESKDLTSLSLDEFTENLKIYEMIIKKDSKIIKAKVERKSLALKAKKESSDEVCLTFGSEDEEYAMAVRDFKKFFRRRECPKPPKDKNQRAFIEGSWSDNDEEDDEKVKNKTCLVAQASSE